MIALLLIGAALAVIIAMNVRDRRRLPTRVARQRLDTQLAELEQQLAALRPTQHDFIAEQEELVRLRWLQDQIAATPVESIHAPGTGPSTHKALREHGISSVGDLTKLGGTKIPSIGQKKEQQLLAAYRETHRRLVDEARRMDRPALDAYSRGTLNAAIERHLAGDLDRLRQVDGIRVRIRDLHRRRAQL